ncbi:cutinase family protein [Nonomuraea sp. NPDC002799]
MTGRITSTREGAEMNCRRPYVLATVLASCLALCATFLTPWPASAAIETISVNPASGPPGTQVTVTGEGWPGDWTVPIGTAVSPGALVTGRSDAQGEFTVKLTIPDRAPAGPLRIWAVIGNGGSADAWFTVGQAAGKKPAGKKARCAVKVIGVHGMGEGPDDHGYGFDSKSVLDTLSRVRKLASDHRRPAVETVMLRYPTTTPQSLFSGRGGPLQPMRKMAAAVKVGVTRLEDEIEKWQRYCSTTKFGLVGYSEGAWVIDAYLSQRADEDGWKTVYDLVRGVQVYGDPQWPDKYAVGPGQAFFLAKGYPEFRLSASPYEQDVLPFQSFCLKGDVICDRGRKALIVDAKALYACIHSTPTCVHQQYTKKATKRGAAWLDTVLYD